MDQSRDAEWHRLGHAQLMKVAIYLSGIPAKSKNQQKRQCLLDFAAGVTAAGDQAEIVQGYETVACDIAVIQGWVNAKTGPHLRIRAAAIDRQRAEGKHIVVIDSNLLGFLAPDDFNRYLRYSLDGIFPTTGYYFDRDIDATRWTNIQNNYQLKERAYRQDGRHVLICLQRNGGWSMGQQDVIGWLDRTVTTLRAHTDRPVVIRAHPGNQEIVPRIKITHRNVSVSQARDIREDLEHAHATVTYNSSPGVASLLWGVPVWVTDPEPAKSQAWPLAQVSLREIEHPIYQDRTPLYHRLGQCHWSGAELRSGEAWRFMRARLP